MNEFHTTPIFLIIRCSIKYPAAYCLLRLVRRPIRAQKCSVLVQNKCSIWVGLHLTNSANLEHRIKTKLSKAIEKKGF